MAISSFPSDGQRGIPAYFTKLTSLFLRYRYRSGVGDSNAANKTPLVIQAAASQTNDLIDVYDSSKNGLFWVDSAGKAHGAAGTDASSYATIDGAQTLTNKTLTSPTITGGLYSDVKSTTAQVTANGTITYADVTGLQVTVVAGTYKFRCVLPSTVASGTGGIKYCFKYTTTALTSIESSAMGFTSAAVAVQHTTTTTDQTDLFTQAAVVILVVIEGTMVVSTGGTIKVQMAQNTSNASNTVALVGGSMEFDRIA
jgi:hypothetical protein